MANALKTSRRRYSILFWLAALAPLSAGYALSADLNCDYCGKPIVNDYITYESHIYHPACYHRNIAPRCAFCSKEILNDGTIHGEETFHKSCYEANVAPRCSVCGGLLGEAYRYDYWGNNYHKRHESEIDRCTFCGRFFTDPKAGGGTTFDSIRKMCSSCSATAVTDPVVARRLIEEALDTLRAIGIDIDPNSFGSELVSRERLTQLAGMLDTNQFGLTYCESKESSGRLVDQDLTIHILHGLPRLHFLSYAAHELMHVWLFLNASNNAEAMVPQLKEGSCNAASCLLLGQLDDELTPFKVYQLELEPDTNYGGGFRRVEKLIDSQGVEYWLDYLRHHSDFPIGY
jgi:hypothetical protein